MSLHLALVWLANQLQVPRPGQWPSWLLRLFIKPPASAPWTALTPPQVPDPAAWAARALGVPRQSPWWLWLWRLVALPPAPWALPAAAKALGKGLGWMLALAWRALLVLIRAVLWPLNLLMRALERQAARLEASGMSRAIGQAADRALQPLLAVPGIRRTVLGLAMIIVAMVITTPLTWAGQIVFLLLAWMASMALRELSPRGRFPSLMLAVIGLMAMGRYAWWRMTNTLTFDSATEAALGCGLLAAEMYTWLVVVLGFFQTAWPLQRQIAELQGPRQDWPSVDVFIPTYNESLDVVRPTALAALTMDWPRDKLRVYLLDDGRREEFRAFAAEAGLQYIARADNRHAKAGNLNHALQRTQGDLVAIFDCDHIPTRSFLKSCVGWFQRDARCAMLQTPHHFFSPDPFERNLGTFRNIPNEGALFYGVVQDGNDFWNATFFCGSCAVIRRAPLMEIGGIAVETVTEDAHTALKLHRRGYTTAYINETQAAGLATESLSAHVGQRIRWARGMAQIFRVDNPLLGKGLTLWQRICYSNAMLHFFFGLPRLVFLTAPMAYLFFTLHIISAHAGLLALYVLPYIVQTSIANAHVQGRYRHTSWGDVYETVLAWYVALPTTLAMINPKLGKFNVTAKGGLVEQAYFDWGTSLPHVALMALNLAAFGIGIVRLLWWNVDESAAVLLNLIWTFYNLVMLGAAMGVASESRQMRRMHRVATQLPAVLHLDNGCALDATCTDYSMSGLGLQISAGDDAPPPPLSAGQQVHVGLWRDGAECVLPAEIVRAKGRGAIGVRFGALTCDQQIELVQCTFARPGAWQNWITGAQDTDRPLLGLQEVAHQSLQGYRKMGRALLHELRYRRRPRARATPPASAQPTPP
ncbi:MAG: UDP-forming cellulose synthase catalytic subunit [Desulfovibrionaceae bacterium]|nr:UDP-forming cellulose synthase catalytic subunit [Desulfovibrionaceae bacterium]